MTNDHMIFKFFISSLFLFMSYCNKKVILVRHAESTSNAGEKSTTSYLQIPITKKGEEQAKELADSITERPELILASQFLRAQQTSEPLCKKFPDVKFEINSNINEIDYIDHDFCAGTTAEQRKSRRDAYWKRMDPSYKDSETVESFSNFIGRAKAFLDDIKSRKENYIVVFTHSLFMVMLTILLKNPNDNDLDLMRKFQATKNEFMISNCQKLEI